MMRWLRRSLLLALVLVVVVLGAGAVALRSLWFHEWLRHNLVSRSHAFLTGDLSVGGLEGDVLRGVTLHDVVLRQQGDVVIAAKTITLTYSLIGLYRGDVSLERVSVESPTIALVEREDGWNVARLLRDRGPRPLTRPSPFAIRSVRVADAHVTLQPLRAAPRELTHVDAAGSLSYASGLTQLTVDSLTGIDPATSLTVTQGSLHLRASAGDWGVDDVRLVTAGSRLTGRARFTRPAGEPVVDLELHAGALALEEVGRYIPAFARHPLTLQLDVTARGPRGAIDVRLDSSSPAGRLSGAFVADLTGSIAKARGSVTTADFNLGAMLQRPDLVGRITAHGTVAASIPGAALARASWSFDVSAVDASAGRYRATLARAIGTYSQAMLRTSFRGEAYGAHADVRIQWLGGTRSPRVAVAGNASRINLTRLGSVFGIRALTDVRLQGLLDGSFDVQWRGTTVRDLAASGTANLTGSTLGGAELPAMHVAGQLDQARLTADLNGSFRAVDIKAFGLVDAVPTSANGDLQAHVVIPDVQAGPRADDIEVTGTVSLGASEVAGQPVDAGTIEGSILNGVATVARLDLSGEALTIHAAGEVAIAGSGSSNLTYAVRTADLGPVGALAGRTLAGSASVEGTLTGSSGRFATTGTLSALRFAYGSATALTLNARFTVGLDGWRLDGLTATASGDGSFLTFGGASADHASAKVSVSSAGIDFDVSLDAPRRSLQVAGNLIVHPDHQEWHVHQLTAGANGMVWALAPGSEPAIQYGGGHLTVERAALVRGAQRIAIDGGLPFDEPAGGSEALDVQLDHVQVADLNALALGTQKLSGQIDGSVRIAGSLRSPAAAADVAVGSGAVNGVAFQQARAKVTYRDATVSVDAELQQNQTNRLTASGTVPLGGRPGLDLHVDSTAIDIGLFQAFTSRLQKMRGAARASVRVTGSTKAPVVSGSVDTTDAAFTAADTGVAYQHVNARLRFDAQAVHIDQLSLADADGHTLTAEGGVAGWLSGPQALDVQLVSNGLHVLNNAFGELTLDGSVHVGGSLEHPEVGGTVRARTARLQADRWLDRYVSAGTPYSAADNPFAPASPVSPASPAAGQTPPAAPAPVPGSLFDRTSISVTLELPDNVLVRGRDLKVTDTPVGLGDVNMTVGGELRYDKPAGAASSLTGRLEVVRGLYYFQGRPFQVVSGSSIEFRGQRPPNPTLDVSADREISGVDARIAIRGTLRRPRLTLSSSPPLDESDVLSLVVFNQPINDLDVSQRNTLANRAATYAEGAVASPLSDSVARALNLDLFDIRPSDSSTGPAVAVGRQVGAVYVSAEERFGETPGSTVSVEYRISKIVKLVTSFVEGVQQTMISRWAEQTGVDLIFVLRY